MLIGNYYNTVDNKGRVFIPAKYRYVIGERVIATKGADGCLDIFTPEAWTDYTIKNIRNRDEKDSMARQLRRFSLGWAKELDIDKQGRINLPQELIDHAKIDKDVVFVGVGDYIEVWSVEEFEREMGPENLDPKRVMAEATETAVEV